MTRKFPRLFLYCSDEKKHKHYDAVMQFKISIIYNKYHKKFINVKLYTFGCEYSTVRYKAIAHKKYL